MLRRLDVLLKQREWIQLRREAEGLLRLPSLDDHALGRVYRALGRAAIGLSQFDSSLQYLEVGLPYALRAGDWDTVAAIWLDLGGVYLVLGNRKDARWCFEEYLLNLNRYTESRHFEGRAHYNLGLLYRQEKEYPLAIAAYKQALQCFRERQALRDAGETHQNIAWLLLIQGKAEEARVHINFGTSLQEASEDFATEQLILHGFLHYVLGDNHTAMGYLGPVLGERVTVSDRHRASARWVAAQVLLQQGEAVAARNLVKEALAIAIGSKETHLVSLCVDLENRIRQRVVGEPIEPSRQPSEPYQQPNELSNHLSQPRRKPSEP